MNCLRSLGRCDRGFGFHLGHGCLVCVYVRLFCVFVALHLGSGLATGRSVVQGVVPTVYRSKEKRNGYKKLENGFRVSFQAIQLYLET
jgi:hypothetical protein